MRCRLLLTAIALALAAPATARDFISTVTVADQLPRIRPEFRTPDEPNQLFYIQRSPNANTVVYVAQPDGKGGFNPRTPVEAFWRKFNIDGSRQPLNFIERMMAYGVKLDRTMPGKPITFTVAALPERKLTLTLDQNQRPEALIQVGSHTVKLAYVYLQVVEGGLMPSVPALDIVGTDVSSGRAIREHLIQK